MANELNEQQYAAPEQELRSAAPVEMATPEPASISANDAPEIASREPSNDGAASLPSIRLVHNNNFKTFSYGEDSPQKKNGLELDQTEEETNAVRNDISLAAVGSSQIRAVQNLANHQAERDTAHTSVRGQQELQRQQAEQKRIAAWNNTQTMVGGVSMTNAQAQAARKNVIENGDRYADWAIEKGYIKEEQREKFKQTAKEMYDLKEQEKINGKMTPEQEQRFESLRRSSEGQAAEKATVQSRVDIDAAHDSGMDSLARKQYEAEVSNKLDMNAVIDRDKTIAAESGLNQKPGTTTGSAANALSPTHINPAFSVKDDFFDAASPSVAATAPQMSPVTNSSVTKPSANTMG